MTQTEQLFRKVFICSEEDLPKEPGIYAAFKDEKGLCWLNYPKTSWFGVKWYLLPIDPVSPKRLSDEEIHYRATLHAGVSSDDSEAYGSEAYNLMNECIAIAKWVRDFYESK